MLPRADRLPAGPQLMTPSRLPRPAARNGLERRKTRRTRESVSATIVVGGFLLPSVVIPGRLRDYDDGGACIRSEKAVRIGTRIRIRLHLPRSIADSLHGLPCELKGRVVAVRRHGPLKSDGVEIVVRWAAPLSKMIGRVIGSYQRQIAVFVALVMAVVIWAKWESLDYFWYAPFFYIYSGSLLIFLLSRFFISWKHRAPLPTGYTPSVSIVISVRNEEAAITRTIETCYRTDYPDPLREIIVVNDGSTDDTPGILENLKKRFPALKVLNQPPLGKRAAMASGVLQAGGEVVVFVDSDTFLFKSALRHIVCGFEDPTLGASAGFTEVENADTNTLTGLQEVRYFVSYQLLKSSEGYYDVVTCCPGCLSAYRRAYLLEILDPWLNQKFLGVPATFGDDRSLTNYILKKYRVIYNDLALASTLVPESWGHYMRQQVRWKKSWLRETLIAGKFMYKKHPIGALSFYSASIFSLLSPIMAVRVVYLAYRGDHSIFLFYMLGLILIGLLQSLYFLYKRPSPHWILGMMWMASALLITGPQTYYAMLTIRKNHWGTR